MTDAARVITVGSPYGKGGMGQHFAQIVEEARAAGCLRRYYATRIRPGDEGVGVEVSSHIDPMLQRFTPLRFSPSWSTYVASELFDRRVAHCLEGAGRVFVGFAGEVMHSFQRARELGYERLGLVAANSHADNVIRQHRKAAQQTGMAHSWMNARMRAKMVREYEMADVIFVHSEYTRQSFVEAGVSERKLRRMVLSVDPRFAPPAPAENVEADGIFRVVYVGRLDATKGVPLLLEAFSRLPMEQKELILVGGWNSREMRRYLQRWMRRDARIRVAPGDPLPVLHAASVFVHPSYEDGFGYAPMEAMACGVPVIATAETGMKEYVREGENGYIVPAGQWRELLRVMVAVHEEGLRGRTEPATSSSG